MGIQRVEEAAHLGRHELPRRQQRMHIEGLADVVWQHRPQQAQTLMA